MQAQDLDIGDPQLRSFDRRQDFRERRNVTARKDVFADPRVGRALARPSGRSSATAPLPSGASSDFELIEERIVVVDADMLEHADRNDSVVVAAPSR